MLMIAIALFAIAAIFGLFVLSSILKDKPTPKPVVFIHGPIAAAGVILAIIYAYYTGSNPLLLTSIALFILAALGGLALFTIDMSNKRIPKLLALAHPLLAVAALILLIVYALE